MDPFAPPADAGQDFLQQQENEMKNLENQFGMVDFNNNDNQNGVAIETVEEVDFFAGSSGQEQQQQQNEQSTPSPLDDLSALDPVSNSIPMPVPVTSSSPSNNNNNNKYNIKVESDNITKWRKEFEQRISDLDNKEAKAMAEWETQAAQDLEEWRRQRQEALEKQRKINLENEKSFIEERESRSNNEDNNNSDGGDNKSVDWVKVSNYCDFNAKSRSKNKNQKDTSRMKSMFLQMKGEQVK